MHKLVTHEYFMDDLQITEIPILTKYLNYVDITSWMQTRELMLSVLRPYLKKKGTTAQELFPLPTDDKVELTKEISNEDVNKWKEYVNNYKKQGEQE